MTRLARFLKRHILWVLLLAVGAPLLVILVMQYKSLTSLEKESRLANDLLLRSYLEAVATEISASYLIKSERSLNLPPQLLKNQSALAEHFERLRWDGARTYFVTAFAADGNAQTTFYSSTQQNAAELRALNEAIAAWKLRAREKKSLDQTGLEIDERDPDNRIIFKPILDRTSRLAGVSGLIVDNSNFKEKYLPAAIQKLRSNYFSADYQEYVIVMVFDKNDRLVLASQPVQGYDKGVVVPLRFVFTDWRMRIHNLAMSHQQWTRHAFTISLSLSVLMTIGILASIIFAFRAASREIRLSQLKSDFIANISHELKTPLTSIRTFGELLQAGWISDPQQVRESGASIESESRRLTQLVDNILDLSQIETRQRLFHFEETDLGEVVADTLTTLGPPLQQKGFQVVCQPLGTPLPPVRLDREAIAQVLTNLIDNAAKYSGKDKRIVLSLEALNGRVTVSVRDYGIGIPSTEKERIFERFHRVNTGFLHDVRGSGIGLSIVKNIVEAHGGRVSVESTAGAGSVFTVSFPIAENDSASSGANEPKGRPH